MQTFAAKLLLGLALCIYATGALALETVKVADGVYAFVGPSAQRSAENLGNNATFGAIVTDAGVILIDAGGSARGAAELEAAVAAVTDQPIKVVINTGGQDHRWFGNAYFKERGAKVIAAAAAVEDQKSRADMQWQVMTALSGADALKGTELAYADVVFDGTHTMSLGGVDIEIVHPGQAHTPGDSFVWLADRRIVFAGDIVFMDRMLGVLPSSNSAAWLASFAALEALNPASVVPGHGRPAPLARAQKETRDYLRLLRTEIGALIENGGTLIDAKKIDQSAFAYLVVFEQISRRNAQAVFTEMEFE